MCGRRCSGFNFFGFPGLLASSSTGMGAKPGGGSTLRGGAQGAASMGRTLVSVGSTLRDGAQGGASMGRMLVSVGSTLRDGAAFGGAAMWLSKVVRSCSAWTLLSVRGAKGELVDGCVKAWTISFIMIL
jgi:hypothetical protein